MGWMRYGKKQKRMLIFIISLLFVMQGFVTVISASYSAVSTSASLSNSLSNANVKKAKSLTSNRLVSSNTVNSVSNKMSSTNTDRIREIVSANGVLSKVFSNALTDNEEESVSSEQSDSSSNPTTNSDPVLNQESSSKQVSQQKTNKISKQSTYNWEIVNRNPDKELLITYVENEDKLKFKVVLDKYEVAISNALIEFAGKEVFTDESGTAVIEIPSNLKGSYIAKVDKAGFGPGSTMVHLLEENIDAEEKVQKITTSNNKKSLTQSILEIFDNIFK